MKNTISVFIILICLSCSTEHVPIGRQAVVSRHNVRISDIDTLNSLTLGNGQFAMTMDVTGLQTFPKHYQKGIPLGTQSEWSWHSFPNTENYSIEETLQTLKSHGREVPYARQWPADTRQGQASNYVRQNPHRIHLANVGWYILKENGSLARPSDIESIDQTLDLWNGELISRFEIEGVAVEVISTVSPTTDALAVQVSSPLIKMGRLGVQLNYPYPSNSWLDEAANYDSLEHTRLQFDSLSNSDFVVQRNLDDLTYFTTFHSSQSLIQQKPTTNGWCIFPESPSREWSFSVAFSQIKSEHTGYTFDELRKATNEASQQFWKSGGMLDFGEVEDARAKELERRTILSLYLTKVNCGGSTSPQETGLTYNSWYGKPHMEMVWWHGVHFALWGRPQILEKQMEWYLRNSQPARIMAERQGFEGVRWQKMTDPNGGETSSSIGSYLIWQQPHIIYFGELIYQTQGDTSILKKYYETIEKTADFMADFAWFDSELGKYILGPGVIPAQERFDPAVTFNPTYELAYWRWGLETAQNWRERLGMKRNAKWDEVLNKLSPLPEKNGRYLATENSPDSYETEHFMTDHPSVLGAYGMLPATSGFDKEVMKNTFNKIWVDWQWEDTWGWDFPMTAMTATRLGMPEKGVDALLMPITTNTYLANGHNYQNETLRVYLPGNGGILTALAMMAVGTNESPQIAAGFPTNWKVKIEGINRMP